MSLAPGRRLGPYEIAQPIGAGGMGEVYRAKDTRLDRAVAVKVLPEHLSNDPALRERFEREARSVSSLNHPHICTLHDVGEEAGVHFLVMEYLEGETLSERLKKGALTLDTALDIARQIADALAAAHGAGIVHRDLKPGNVILTKLGVKLLDFGLAKTRTENVAPSRDSEQPTQNKPLTDAGTILGTVQYMAPEQLEGKEVDARADIFALGAILFEMVTGRKAFEGESQASLISAIMSTEPPPVSELQSVSPPSLDRVVKKCLAKDPDARWHSAHDLGTELVWIASPDNITELPSRPTRQWLPWATVAMAALAAVLFVRARNPVTAAPNVARFETTLDNFITTSAPGLVLSPDGKYFVYRSAPPTQLMLQPLASLSAHALDGSARASQAFFSPDSRWVACVVDNQLKKVSIEGGRSAVIGEAPPGGLLPSGTWGRNGTILVATGAGLYRYPDEGGSPIRVVEIDPGMGDLLHPHWLPDGRHALVTVKQGAQNAIHVVDVSTGEMQELIASGSQAIYLTSGHLVYRIQSGTLSELYAVEFDAHRLLVRGTPVALPEAVFAIESAGGGYFDISEAGHLAYLPSATTFATSLVWAEKGGVTSILDIEPGVFRRPSLSPDGRRVAVDSHVGGAFEHDIWIYDLRTGSRTRFTVPGHNSTPVWTPDGARLAFASRRPPETPIQSIYWKRTRGDDRAELLISMEFETYPVSWTPDGRTLAFVVAHPDTQNDVWVITPGAQPQPLLVTEFNEHSPMFSPDGKWLAYVSDESGRSEVYVRTFPGEGTKYAVSTSGGREPLWSHDGRTLFLRSGDGAEMWSAEVELDPTFRASKPELVFSGNFLVDWNREQSYDVSADGRFLMIDEIEESAQSSAVVVLNWVEELKRLVPVEN